MIAYDNKLSTIESLFSHEILSVQEKGQTKDIGGSFFYTDKLIEPNITENGTVFRSLNKGTNSSEAYHTHRPLHRTEVYEEWVRLQLKWAEAVREPFRTIQKWEGYVIDLGEETFLARLIPIIGEGPEIEAEIYLEELDEDSRSLVMRGAVFYWSIGYLDKISGRRRESIIRFRRLITWTKQELESIDTEVAELRSIFDDSE